MLWFCLSDFFNTDKKFKKPILNLHVDQSTLHQFFGAQRLEEHYYPTSLSYGNLEISLVVI